MTASGDCRSKHCCEAYGRALVPISIVLGNFEALLQIGPV